MTKVLATVELFTPILDGKRVRFENVKVLDGNIDIRKRGLKAVIETANGKRYNVYGIPCELGGCMCDAMIIEVQ